MFEFLFHLLQAWWHLLFYQTGIFLWPWLALFGWMGWSCVRAVWFSIGWRLALSEAEHHDWEQILKRGKLDERRYDTRLDRLFWEFLRPDAYHRSVGAADRLLTGAFSPARRSTRQLHAIGQIARLLGTAMVVLSLTVSFQALVASTPDQKSMLLGGILGQGLIFSGMILGLGSAVFTIAVGSALDETLTRLRTRSLHQMLVLRTALYPEEAEASEEEVEPLPRDITPPGWWERWGGVVLVGIALAVTPFFGRMLGLLPSIPMRTGSGTGILAPDVRREPPPLTPRFARLILPGKRSSRTQTKHGDYRRWAQHMLPSLRYKEAGWEVCAKTYAPETWRNDPQKFSRLRYQYTTAKDDRFLVGRLTLTPDGRLRALAILEQTSDQPRPTHHNPVLRLSPKDPLATAPTAPAWRAFSACLYASLTEQRAILVELNTRQKQDLQKAKPGQSPTPPTQEQLNTLFQKHPGPADQFPRGTQQRILLIPLSLPRSP